MREKHCNRCDTIKPIEDFALNRTRKDGRQTMCRLCKKVYDKKDYQKNKSRYVRYALAAKRKARNWLNQYKSDRGCTKCGFNKHPAALHIHHLNPDLKTITPSYMAERTWSIKRMEKELSTCRV